jgi:hypothetical protein
VLNVYAAKQAETRDYFDDEDAGLEEDGESTGEGDQRVNLLRGTSATDRKTRVKKEEADAADLGNYTPISQRALQSGRHEIKLFTMIENAWPNVEAQGKAAIAAYNYAATKHAEELEACEYSNLPEESVLLTALKLVTFPRNLMRTSGRWYVLPPGDCFSNISGESLAGQHRQCGGNSRQTPAR